MKDCCENKPDQSFGRVLWVALALNMLMFVVEIYFSVRSESSSLIADSLDFLGDSFNYGLSIIVFSMSAIIRSRASQLKGLTMLIFGLWILFDAYVKFASGVVPDYQVMSWIGGLALLVNLSVALLLYKFRAGDSQMQSVWLCTRNDVIGNAAVIVAAFGVLLLGHGAPDLIVGGLMAILAITSGFKVMKVANKEILELKL